MSVIGAAVLVFSITRLFASPHRPHTMTKEWQEATEEYMQVRFTGGIVALFMLGMKFALPITSMFPS